MSMRDVLAKRWAPVVTILVAVALFAIVTTFSVGVFIAIRRGISNDGWIAIATAVYAFCTLLTFAVLLAAALGALRQLSLADEERRLGILLQLSSRWDSELLRKGRRLANRAGDNLKEAIEKYEAKDDEKYYLISAVANFFEDVGIITVKRKLWSTEEARDRFGPSIKHYYKLFSDYIEEAQKIDRSILENFSKLAVEIEECRGSTSSS